MAGSGPAGLAIVSRIVGRGLSLALIEAGSRRRDRADEEPEACRATAIPRPIASGAGCSAAPLPSGAGASRNVRPEGIGNHSDDPGRQHMTHVTIDVGELPLTSAIEGGKIDYRRSRDGISGRSLIRPTDACRQCDRLPKALGRPALPPNGDAAHLPDPVGGHLGKLPLPKEHRPGLVGAAALPPDRPRPAAAAGIRRGRRRRCRSRRA